MHESLRSIVLAEQLGLLDTALQALDDLKGGDAGVMGPTGTLLEDSLMKLRKLLAGPRAEIRLSIGLDPLPADCSAPGG